MRVVFAFLVLSFLLPSAAEAASASRNFHAALAAEWETKFTESPAEGIADFHLDLETLTFTWKVTFKGLSGAIDTIRLYGPAQPGANGAVIFELGKKGATSPVAGSRVLTEAQVQYLLYGWTYINITTVKWPNGEIRGQLDVTPAPLP